MNFMIKTSDYWKSGIIEQFIDAYQWSTLHCKHQEIIDIEHLARLPFFDSWKQYHESYEKDVNFSPLVFTGNALCRGNTENHLE